MFATAAQQSACYKPPTKHVALRPRHQRRHKTVCSLTTGSPQAAPKTDPFATKNEYNDNFWDKLFISIYSRKMAAQLNNVTVPKEPQYDDFVRISKEIMRGRTSEKQRVVVRNVLMSLLPPNSPAAFRKLFPPTQLSAELNAWFASIGFGWLVGEMELRNADIEVAPGVTRNQKSVVYIKKCRYLENSGCVGMCVNMCKLPTQSFFTDDFGLPLTMKPNFEDLSCEMIFGQAPPNMEDDPAYVQPCFISNCNIASDTTKTPCPRTDTSRAKDDALLNRI